MKNSKGDVPTPNYLTQIYSHLDVSTLGIVEKTRLKQFFRDWVGAANEDREKAEEQVKDLFEGNVRMICLPTDRMDQREKNVSTFPTTSIALQALPACVALGPSWAGWRLKAVWEEEEIQTREEEERARLQEQEWAAEKERRAIFEELVRERGRATRAQEQPTAQIYLPYSVRFAK